MAASQQQLVQRAHVAALLKIDPQRQAIQQLALEARQNAVSAVRGAASTSRINTAAINKAVPTVQGIYDRAAGTTSATNSGLAQALAALGPQASGFNAAATSESAAGADRLARERAATEGNLQEQKVAAAEAPQFARTLATQQLNTTLGKLQNSYQALAGQEGAAQADALDKELARVEAEGVTERGQNLTAGNAAAGRQLSAREHSESLHQSAQQHSEDLQYKREHPSGSATGPGGVKLLTTSEQVKAAQTIRGLEHEVRGLWKTHSPSQILAELTSESPETTANVIKRDENGKPIVKEDKSGKKTYEYEQVKHKAIAASDPLLVQAAIDSAFKYGTVSHATLQALHNAGYSIKALRLQPPSASNASSAPSQPAGRANERRR